MATSASASQESTSSSMTSEPMSDELIAHVAPVLLPVRDMNAVAYEVLGLTQDQVEAECFTPSMLSDSICKCLRLGMERQRIHTVQQLKEKLMEANKGNAISTNAITDFDTLERKSTMQEICTKISRHITQNNMYHLFCGYFGLTREEIEKQQPQAVDHRTVCIRLLSLWRRLNPGCNSAKHLIQALEKAVLVTEENKGVGVGADELYKGDAEAVDSNEDGSKRLCVEYGPYNSETLNAVKKIVESGYQCNTSPHTSSTTEVESLCLKLKDRYAESYYTLNPLPWLSTIEASVLNNVFITLYVDEEKQERLGEEKRDRLDAEKKESKTISMNDLFTQHIKDSSTPAKLILLHGEAGSGKTTLTAKIALDWATGQTQINKLLDFSAVFVIKASLIEEGDTLNEYIKREYPSRAAKTLNIEEELCDANILFIIDGYDERRSKTDFINDLLSRKNMCDSTILLTSRYGATQNIQNLFHIKVGLRGFSRSDINSFVEEHANHDTRKIFLQMHATNHLFIDTLSNPLYLWIFVILGDDYFRDIQSFTRTQFYSQTLLGIAERAKHILCQNSNVNENDIEGAINKNLCPLAYKCMKHDTLQISDVASVDKVTEKLGLLNKTVSRRGMQERTVFVFAHKTIMEYLAAKHIVSANNLTKQRNIQSTDNHNIIPACEHLLLFPEVKDEARRLASMVVVFVCGLLSTTKEAVTDIMRELVPDISDVYDKHADHFGLSCLCELDDTQWIPVELLERRIKKSLNLGSACTPYCGHGLGKYSRVRTLKFVQVREYTSRHVSYINTESFTVRRCDGSVVTSLVTALDKSCVVKLKIDGKTLTGEQCRNIIQHLTECSRLEQLDLWHVKLRGDVDRLLTTDAHAPPSLNKLRVGGSGGTHPSVWICWSWCSVSEVELVGVHLSSDDVTSIATTAQQQSAAPTRLRLKWLHNAGTSGLLNALCNTGCVHRLQELWVEECTSDDDCAAVGHFLSQCTQIWKLTWLEPQYDSVSVAALTDMWLQIATEATHLHTVTVQECAEGSRVDDVFMSVLREKLTSQQRRHIQWRVVRLMDKWNISSMSTHSITDSECRCVYTLLPSVCEVWRGDEDGKDWVKVERG